ncbi:septal ring lytic transglycosylase RlpA family protein [Patescibacteria group bacterium]|nr:septal ring lytic transglycosylase RlpA family protein [Patescibacteria group bacterium]
MEFKKRTLILTVIFLAPLLAGLIYLLTTYKHIDAQVKTISLSVNGLSTEYTTTAQTVGEFIAPLYPDRDKIVSVFPSESQPLTSGDIIFLQLKPTAVNRAVASNLKTAIEKSSEPEPKSPVYQGTATWYAFGEGMNAASTQFPKGTRLRVMAVNSNKIVDVVINDYGPEKWTGVALDLNKPAFMKLAPLGAGKIKIKYFII